MKTLKTLLSVFAIAAVFSAGAYAQTNTSVDVSADVLTTIAVDNTQNLDFGTVLDGSSPIFDTNASTNDASLGQAATIGFIELTAEPSTDLSIDFDDSDVTVSNITWTPDVTGHTANDRDASSDLDGNPATTGNTSAATTGKYWIFVGGSLDLSSASGGDSFTSTFNVTINYF